MFAALTALLASALVAQPAQAPTAADRFAQLQDDLRRSHESGDAGAYLANSQVMYTFLNGSPRATLQLMSAQSAAGKSAEALDSFAKFLAMGQANEEVLQSKSFDALRALPEYPRLHAEMAANSASLSSAAPALRLTAAAKVPEDIDYDPAGKLFYITTVLGQQILQVDGAGRTHVFAASPDHWPMMALKVDLPRRILWATEVALNGFASVAKPDWGRSAILQYDLRSGMLLHRAEGPPQAALGDMALDANGDAIVSDGEHGGVYRVARLNFRIERLDGGDFVSPQTPVVLPDGRHILVPDYVRGIGSLDLKSKRVAWLPMEGKHALSGIDGLYAAGNTLIATQNGTNPERVVRFTLGDSKARVLSESIIERAGATLGDPTHGVMVGEYFYYIANSGWDALDDHGNLLEGKTLPAATIMRARIAPNGAAP
jgi:hypothetical protein